ncbi:hypothetical protein B0H14DRAFT_3860829 [Mycena olivaceomarginata]|nr:hypothetical protein B0H14DRAFT_3860829 [Mycena olivaceomarginata]
MRTPADVRVVRACTRPDTAVAALLPRQALAELVHRAPVLRCGMYPAWLTLPHLHPQTRPHLHRPCARATGAHCTFTLLCTLLGTDTARTPHAASPRPDRPSLAARYSSGARARPSDVRARRFGSYVERVSRLRVPPPILCSSPTLLVPHLCPPRTHSVSFSPSPPSTSRTRSRPRTAQT